MENAKKIKIIAFVTISIVIISLALVSYFIGTSEGDILEKKEDGINTYPYNFKTNFDYELLDGNLISISDKEIEIINFNNEKKMKAEVEINNPILKILNDKILVYEKQGNQIVEYDKKCKVLNEYEIDGQILDVFSVSKNYIGIIYKRKRYNTSLLIIDNWFKSYFERAYENAYVTDCMFYEKNTILIFLFDTSKEKLLSYYEVFNYGSSELKEKNELSENLFLDFYLDEEENIFCISSNKILINKNTKETIEIEFDKEDIIWARSIYTDKIMIIVQDQNKKQVLKIIKYSGEVQLEKEINDINNIVYYENKIYLIRNSNIEQLDETFNTLNTYEYSGIIKKVFIENNKLYVVQKDRVDITMIK